MNQSLRWASCIQAGYSEDLSDVDLKMRKAMSDSVTGVQMVERTSDVGIFMRQAGLEEWWRKAMGYTKGG